MNESAARFLGLGAVGAPLLLLTVLSAAPFLPRRLSERATARWTASCVVGGLASVLAMLLMMLFTGEREVSVELGDWVALPAEGFHFRLNFLFDRLSVPFAALTFVLVGVTGAFADRYLHREPGYQRFFLYFAVFLLGMEIAALGGTIETLFIGWELVGLASALLVAFFHERSAPVFNALRIWSVYRFSDAAFLIAALTLHHLSGAGDFAAMAGSGAWPGAAATIPPWQAFGVGLLLLAAAAGKSALLPFSGWLPRAMEGPTPSSAVFYGALSVHLGTYLLLRTSAILNASTLLCACVVLVGAATAVFGVLAGRVQSDVKSALAFASLTQVGVITAEIGLGFRYLALIHIIGHACQRTLQLLRSPSLLNDYRILENALGGPIPHPPGFSERRFSLSLRRRLYRIGFDRGQLDAAIDRFIVRPFGRVFQWCDRMERRWTDFLSGKPSDWTRETARQEAPPVVEESR